tara:strand:- start:184 stop:864 length:681 start_codon:yes stop_codon:yes gene_type:complete
MKDLKIHRFSSQEKQTPFAPQWNYNIIEGQIEDVDFSYIANYLLQKQDEILKLKPTHDGCTGLGLNTTTARHANFNIFNFEDTEINKLKINISSLHNVLLKHMGMADAIPYINLYTQCWYNVMTKGQQISTHIHDVTPTCYLGGHITVQCDDTYTGYTHSALVPILDEGVTNSPLVHESKNKVGKITLFPNYIPHFTSVHNGDKERVTIAFDLTTHQSTANHFKIS